MISFGSVCSGIEAASVAWGPLGWRAAWFAEIEPFPSALLAHHYPDVPNLGDMRGIGAQVLSGEVEAPDILCGGTPCQAFSVAGLRNSLDDERGNLSLTFCELANDIDKSRFVNDEKPAIIFWENVPGVLNTHDNAFGCFLAGLAGESDALIPPGGRWSNAGFIDGPQRAVAWRILDAQYFGVAQRRRRVFVVASARDDFDPAAVLFEFNGLRRDIAPSRQAGQSASRGVEFGPSGGRFTDLNPTLDARCKDGPIRNQLAGAVASWWDGGQVSQTLDAVLSKGQTMPEKNRFPAVLVPAVAVFQQSSMTGRGTIGYDDSGIAKPVKTQPDGQMVVIGIDEEQNAAEELMGCLKARVDGGGFKGSVMTPAMQVRRLTPTECERLQGFPDGYTQVPYRGKPAADGPRYKALGNSWAVPVARWIGERVARCI